MYAASRFLSPTFVGMNTFILRPRWLAKIARTSWLPETDLFAASLVESICRTFPQLVADHRVCNAILAATTAVLGGGVVQRVQLDVEHEEGEDDGSKNNNLVSRIVQNFHRYSVDQDEIAENRGSDAAQMIQTLLTLCLTEVCDVLSSLFRAAVPTVFWPCGKLRCFPTASTNEKHYPLRYRQIVDREKVPAVFRWVNHFQAFFRWSKTKNP